MNGPGRNLLDETQAAAAAWVVRLRARDAGEAEWLAFETWLDATPGARAAYDAAAAIWLLADDLDAEIVVHAKQRSLGSGMRVGVWRLMALSLCVAAMAGVVMIRSRPAIPPTTPATATVYATTKGERRTVVLADATRLDLDGDSHVEVSLDARGRRVTMTQGEAAFTVTHDPRRPFTVIVGDRRVSDLGTEFDIRRAGSQVRVTVRRGEVEVAAKGGAPGAAVTLGAGRQLVHDDGGAVSTVRTVSADDVFAWQQGRLIYRDQPLSAVVDDLNRYFPHAVRIEGQQVAALRFTGVLTLGGEEATIRRLVGLLPISATRINGATVLKSREETR